MVKSPLFFRDRPQVAKSRRSDASPVPAPGDPLSQVVELLRPRAVFANIVSGKGAWAVRYSEYGLPSFCIVLDGSCVLDVDDHEPLFISAGDFILLPATPAFTLSGFDTAPPVHMDPHAIAGRTTELRYGDPQGYPDMRSLGGSFQFDSADSSLLVSLLPRVLHIRGSTRLSRLVAMVGEESGSPQPGSEFMLGRLVEVMLVEAMRQATAGRAPPGLLQGLGDARLAPALKQLHARVAHPWTVGELAKTAAMSRSAFSERFTQRVGMAPMEYLQAWRMEIAKQLLRGERMPVSAVAERVGYGSTSAFTAAFSRRVGQSPARFAQVGAGPQ
jgi:AraC-like DNA-binding protein